MTQEVDQDKPELSGQQNPVEEFSPDEVELGRVLFAGECTFMLGAAGLDQIPETELPEIAFAGRSNVGKSSLINALTNRNALARTSHTPGRTQQINFFDLSGRITIGDLPGYGYARAPKDQVAKWTRMVNGYLKGRRQLVRVMLLVDARHGVKDVDRKIMKMLDDAAVSYQVVLTKADKIKEKERTRLISKTASEISTHIAAYPFIHLCSSHKGMGIEGLRADIGRIATQG
ncbi:MAG: YihA family ribosome biogenesis GTP-binding protein [Rhodospirillaceae bacterium]|nr:YihA family ribosome biogenesis GTP-binding protein [Rhodospirillaceae bacterium]